MGQYKTEIDDDKTIVYVYIKSFEWHNKNDEKMLKGHPSTGSIYRAIKLENKVIPATIYQIKIDSLDEDADGVLGISVNGLSESHSNFTCEIEEVTEDNIIDLEISEDDYRKLGKWMESENDDFIDLIRKLENPEEQYIKIPQNMLPEAFQSQVRDMIGNLTDEYRKNAVNGLDELIDREPLVVEILGDYIQHTLARISKEDQTLLKISNEIALHEDMGKGANVYSAMYNIEDYVHPKTGGDTNSLYKVLDAIVMELSRIKLHNNE